MVTSQVQKVNLLTSMLLFIYSSGCGCYCRAFGDLRTNFRYCLHKTFFMFPWINSRGKKELCYLVFCSIFLFASLLCYSWWRLCCWKSNEAIFRGSEKGYQGTKVVCRVSLQKHICRIWLCFLVTCHLLGTLKSAVWEVRGNCLCWKIEWNHFFFFFFFGGGGGFMCGF
jgi:hypothetical protein